MANSNYHKLHKSLLRYSEDIRRYQLHNAFITIYLNLNEVPKGFRIKFHDNIPYRNYNQILKTCSLKLMAGTVGIYKKNLSDSKINFQNVISTLRETFSEKISSTIRVIEERAKAFANILSNRRKRKFQRDKIDLEKALNSSNEILKQLMNNKTPVLNEKQLREKLLEGQKIPSSEPLNLQKNDKPLTDGLKYVCSKGLSFVPVSPHHNWLQLQKDFDKLRNSLRVAFSLPTKNKIVTVILETTLE